MHTFWKEAVKDASRRGGMTIISVLVSMEELASAIRKKF